MKEIIKFLPTIDAPAETKLPQRGTKFAAGYDFYAPCDIEIPAHGISKLVPFNIKAQMPCDMFLMLKIRSGLSVKHNVMLACSGVIDADYFGNADNDGNIGAKFCNLGDNDYVIQKGERCMQGIFLKYGVTFNDMAQKEREGGYGSTGK